MHFYTIVGVHVKSTSGSFCVRTTVPPCVATMCTHVLRDRIANKIYKVLRDASQFSAGVYTECLSQQFYKYGIRDQHHMHNMFSVMMSGTSCVYTRGGERQRMLRIQAMALLVRICSQQDRRAVIACATRTIAIVETHTLFVRMGQVAVLVASIKEEGSANPDARFGELMTVCADCRKFLGAQLINILNQPANVVSATPKITHFAAQIYAVCVVESFKRQVGHLPASRATKRTRSCGEPDVADDTRCKRLHSVTSVHSRVVQLD